MAADAAPTPPVAEEPRGEEESGKPTGEEEKPKKKWVWVWVFGKRVPVEVPVTAEDEPEKEKCQHQCKCYTQEILAAQYVKKGGTKKPWPSFGQMTAKREQLKKSCKAEADLLCTIRNPRHLKCACPGEPLCDFRDFEVSVSYAWQNYGTNVTVRNRLPPKGTKDSEGTMWIYVLYCEMLPVTCEEAK